MAGTCFWPTELGISLVGCADVSSMARRKPWRIEDRTQTLYPASRNNCKTMTDEKINVLHAVTVSLSLALMSGQLRYLRTAGFRPAALCSPGPQVEDLRIRESAPVFTVAMEREVAPIADLVSLVRIWRFLRRVR